MVDRTLRRAMLRITPLRGHIYHRATERSIHLMNSAELAAEFARLGPWIFQFQIDGQAYGGGISAVGDARIDQFFRFAPEVGTVMELGSLEGAQTFLLAERPGVRRV